MSARKVSVAVAPGAVVYVDGTGHGEGSQLEVAPKDAEALRGQGVVTS